MKVRDALNAPSYAYEAPLGRPKGYYSPLPSRRSRTTETPEVPSKQPHGNPPNKSRRSLFGIFNRQQKQTQKPPAVLVASSHGDRKATMPVTEQGPPENSTPLLGACASADDRLAAADDNTLGVRRMEVARRKWPSVKAKSYENVRSITNFLKKKWVSPQGEASSKTSHADKPCAVNTVHRSMSAPLIGLHGNANQRSMSAPLPLNELDGNANQRSMSAPLIGLGSEVRGDMKPLKLTTIADSLKVSDGVAGRMLEVHMHNILHGCPAEAEVNTPTTPLDLKDRRVKRVSELLGTSFALARRMLAVIPFAVRIDGLGPDGYFEDSMFCTVTDTRHGKTFNKTYLMYPAGTQLAYSNAP